MDTAYDHVQEEVLSPGKDTTETNHSSQDAHNINTELAEAFKAVSTTQWGSAIGGWWSTARKQGESLYNDLSKEAGQASEQATRGFTSLRDQVVQRTRGMSLNAEPGPQNSIPGEEAVPGTSGVVREEPQAQVGASDRPESLPADIVKEAGSLVASLRTTAAARLKDLQKAEDAADEALLKFGTNVRNFLRDAVTITAPSGSEQGAELLFETSEPGTGKKIFHSTRMDAQLHAIHTTAASFTNDPEGAQWQTWHSEFDIEKQTDAIAKDLKRYEELRRAMEKLVPELVDYKTFWTRYYFLRKAIEEEERRRKEVLKGAAADHAEEVGWDDDDEDEEAATPNTAARTHQKNESTTTLTATEKLNAPRRSHEDEKGSVADSDASYDIVSGATSRATGSPKEERKKEDDSDEDWE